MSELSEILNKNGLKSWSHVSEDTRENLSQVPWIKEKVQSHEKDAHALQGAGIWSATDLRITDSPERSRSGDEGDADSINLESAIQIPEFSLRITGDSEPPKRPIGEVLDDVRKSYNIIKGEIQIRRAATAPLLRRNYNALEKKDREVPQRQLKSSHPKSPLRRVASRHRHDSLDSQKCELQLFPAEIVMEENSEKIRQRLPHSIRDQCIFKDNYWWYKGNPSNLSGLSRDKSSLGLAPGIGDSTMPSHPIIQKGSITIAGRPLLIEGCFTRRPSAAWTCKPDSNLMTDTPIPGYKDGDTIVVPLASIATPPGFNWDELDPLGEKTIDPRSFSQDDLQEIAKIVWPHEFCLYLDGTLQVMLDNKKLQKIKSYPKKIGGLNVSFSNYVASSTQTPLHRSRHSKSTKPGKLNPVDLRQAAIGKSDITSSEKGSSSQISSSIQSQHQGVSSLPNSSNVKSETPTASTESATLSSSPPLTSVLPPPSPPPPPPHVPCEVIVGESIDLGVPCFVGVKVRDGAIEKITIPTSAALEAACKARRASGTLRQIKKYLQGEQAVSVIGLNLWTKAEPHQKIGKITRCFDSEGGRFLTMKSVNPDDLLYDVCLVEGEGADAFAAITSPSGAWWVTANQSEPSQIVQNTLLHIVCPMGTREDAIAVDGVELQRFAHVLPAHPPNAVYQGLRVVPHGFPHVNESRHGPHHLQIGAKRLIPKIVLATSTLYRFLGPVESWKNYRGAAVVEVNRETSSWGSVVGLHSFEYLVRTKGSSEKDMTWDQVRKGLLTGSLSFWGCRHLPVELARMQLV